MGAGGQNTEGGSWAGLAGTGRVPSHPPHLLVQALGDCEHSTVFYNQKARAGEAWRSKPRLGIE